ncbi:MAG: hypothetical protein HY562_10170 [Ignavibacteriales bacterium]|nr:hypothetical protein [Ignavibacteriales bacterium]
MRNFILLFAGSVLLASAAFAQGRFTEEKLKQIDENLVLSLQTNYPGVVASAVKTVRDVKALAPDYNFSHSMTVSLMRMVKNEEADAGVRILSAFALNDLDSEIGNYAIKMESKFSESDRFKRVCSWLTYNRAVEQQIARNEKEGTKSIATK